MYLELHGDQAIAKARETVRTIRDNGDDDGADTWLRIIVAIETMQRGLDGSSVDPPFEVNSPPPVRPHVA